MSRNMTGAEKVKEKQRWVGADFLEPWRSLPGTWIFIEHLGLPWWFSSKESACNAGDLGSPRGQEDPLEKGMATHSSILAWRIPWTEEPGGLQSMGSQEVGGMKQLSSRETPALHGICVL